jgi:hypothetical protein
MLVSNKVLKELGRGFDEKLRKLKSVETIEIKATIATTDLAKLLYGEIDYYYLLNKYNKRVPKPFFEIGEKVKYPTQESIEDLIETFVDNKNVALIEKDVLPL